MEDMGLNLKQNNTIPPNMTSKVSDFITAEQGTSLGPSISSNDIQLDSEHNNEDVPSQSVNEGEPKEQTYQDILGSGDLLKKIIKQGALDERPMKGEQIVINLVGRLEDNDDIFEKEDNFEITLGDCEVIQGVDLALSLMNVGEIAELKIASRFGYGEKGLSPKVLGGARLVYIVELVSVKPEILPDDLTPIERLNIGLKKKDKGNWWYARNENTMALHVYRKALQYFGGPGDIIGSDSEQKDILSERVKTLNNMAAVHMSMNSLDLALSTLDSVLAVEPNNEKAIMRKGKVLALKGQNMAAARELEKALQINPNNKTVQSILSNVKAALVKERVQERELYKKMLGQKDNNEKSAKDDKNTSTTFIISGLVAGLAVICGYCYLNNNFPFSKFSTL
ncbi:peptidyl-prolyl cis-trans isomerase FKBP8 [Myzus persicae]|uniref:peptidyl-prolyl cis-trans isomerase FKBP8 n=1 Tax=Myzus persicae TaxID=13164 RepID=UPI000B9332EC|nr:peptidyl-prolyl cis-trans isomerase FKBP8 [Myzus persicae]XP_022181774.1 peptidyl-prolyl cis-trans isomerase FKBP8 [Myzus persicae]XP_022181775.1 peptidyl-prolyl cis-trans isomerase FKBP8 [Myzus persicae]